MCAHVCVCMGLPTYVCVVSITTSLSLSLSSLRSHTIVSSLFEGFNMSASTAHYAHYIHTQTERRQPQGLSLSSHSPLFSLCLFFALSPSLHLFTASSFFLSPYPLTLCHLSHFSLCCLISF